MTSVAERNAVKRVKRSRRMEQAVRIAAQRLRERPDEVDVNTIAEAAVRVAKLLREVVEDQAAVVATMTAENLQLRRALDRVTGTPDCDVEDDSRLFGTHLRQAWHALTGR